MVDPIIYVFITLLAFGVGLKVTTTQNPVYSGLYLVLLFLLGSAIAFLLGFEFIALLFLLVYAGAIAVLVLFVVMMLDVKAIENPWSASEKQVFYVASFVLSIFLVAVFLTKSPQSLLESFTYLYISGLFVLSLYSYENDIKNNFSTIFGEPKNSTGYSESEIVIGNGSKSVESNYQLWNQFCDSEGLGDFFHLLFKQDSIKSSHYANKLWFVDFDSSCALDDPSYLLYTTYALLLIVAGIILLIAMIGAISLTLQKNCPESLYRQLGRESKNAVFLVKEKNNSYSTNGHLEAPR